MKYIVKEDRQTKETEILKCEVGWNYLFIEGRASVLIDWWQREYILENKGNFNFEGDTITKVSDTIEGLFDCFVDHDCEYDAYLVTNDSTRLHNHEIYGAIWTKRGLIYVAKMNDNREWELL